MISGEFDPVVPLQDAHTAFELIGTAENDKRMVIAPSGHSAPYELLVRETLAWFDKYLGVPRKR